MRRTPAWLVAAGLIVGWAGWPSAASAGVWLTLAAGVPGDAAPTSQDDFWFETPHGPSQVAINQLSGGTTAEAVTGGGNVFFGGAGTPVLVNLSDGSAFVTSGPTPSGARTPSPSGGGGGGGGGGLSSAAPSAGGEIPPDAALLGIGLAEPDANGDRGLTATVTDSLGNPLGTATIGVPVGGWWVIGLTPEIVIPGPVNPPPTDPEPTDPPTDPEPTNPGPVDPPDPDPIGGGDPTTPPPVPVPEVPNEGPVATPEPSTLMLFALGGLTLRAWRRMKATQAD